MEQKSKIEKAAEKYYEKKFPNLTSIIVIARVPVMTDFSKEQNGQRKN